MGMTLLTQDAGTTAIVCEMTRHKTAVSVERFTLAATKSLIAAHAPVPAGRCLAHLAHRVDQTLVFTARVLPAYVAAAHLRFGFAHEEPGPAALFEP